LKIKSKPNPKLNFEPMKTLALITWMVSVVAVSELADVTGRWTGMVMGQFEVSYDFKQEGEVLTGSTIGPDGTKMDITNGSVKGEDVAFTLNFNGTPMPITGKVKENVMSLSFAMDGNPIAFELKKAEK
jgi:hypothetical protein